MSPEREAGAGSRNRESVDERVQQVLGPTFDRLAHYLLTGCDQSAAREELVEGADALAGILAKANADDGAAEDLQRGTDLIHRILMTERLVREHAVGSSEQNSG